MSCTNKLLYSFVYCIQTFFSVAVSWPFFKAFYTIRNSGFDWATIFINGIEDFIHIFYYVYQVVIIGLLWSDLMLVIALFNVWRSLQGCEHYNLRWGALRLKFFAKTSFLLLVISVSFTPKGWWTILLAFFFVWLLIISEINVFIKAVYAK